MKKAFILPFAVLSALGLVTVASCGGNSSSSVPSSGQPSSSEVKSSESVSSSSELVVENLEIANLEALMADWHLGDSPRTIDLNITPEINVLDALNKGILKVTSTDPSVAAVNGLGLSALKVGEAMIRVEVGGKTLSFSVNVLPVKTYQSVAATLEEVKDLAAGETKNNILTKGVVTKIPSNGVWSDQYKNITLYIGDEGAGNELECYRAVVAEGIDGSKIKVGDTISITGNVTNYQGTLEYAANSVITEVIPGKNVEPEKPAVKTIAEIEDNRKVELSGVTVVAKNAKAIVVSDGTNSVYVYANKDLEVAIGDVVNVTGLGSLYHNGYLQIGSPTVTKVESGTPVTVTPVAATKEIVDGWKTGKFSFAESKPYTWTTKVGISGTFLTTPFEGSETVIEPAYAAEGLIEQGKEYEITAYFVGYDAKYNYACVVIMSAQEKTYAPESVTITGDQTVRVKETLTLSASVTPAKAAQDIVWSSEDPTKATVSENGVVTGVGEGTVKIIATAKGTTVKAEYSITVEEALPDPVESLTLTAPKDVTGAAIGETVTLTATVSPSTAPQGVTFESSDETVATVSGTGVVTFVGDGPVTITAKTVGKDGEDKEISKTIDLETQVEVKTFAQLQEVAKTIENKKVSEDSYYFRGTVIALRAVNNFLVSDGTGAVNVYGIKYSGENAPDVKVGDKVLVNAKLEPYNSAIEMVEGTIIPTKATVGKIETEPTVISSKAAYEALAADDTVGANGGKLIKIENAMLTASGSYQNITNIAGEDVKSTTYAEKGVKLPENNVYGTFVGYVYSNYASQKSMTLWISSFTPNAESEKATKVTISGPSKVNEGSDIQLSAVALDNETFTNTTATVTWESADTTIATVDATGKVVGVKEGKVNITAKVNDEVFATQEITVESSFVGVKLNANNLLGYEKETVAYSDTAQKATVGDIDFTYTQIGAYGSGMQMRVKNGVASYIANTEAFAKGIKEIRITLNEAKGVKDNTDVWQFNFEDSERINGESTTLSTVEGQLTYTVTPSKATYTYFSLEKILASYTFYVDEIAIVYAE